ncbi:M23 family metallopeptidase [Streptomyces sp. P1-3]|uniref:M23 family metallopeptidase n=1 Tax=Streptomyces sp. P1-3 TaxID=3421658 RepID=UPI003D36F78A
MRPPYRGQRFTARAVCSLTVVLCVLPACDGPALAAAPPAAEIGTRGIRERAADRAARASADVVRLHQKAGEVARRYEQGRAAVRRQRAETRRVARALRHERHTTERLRQAAGRLARERYRSGALPYALLPLRSLGADAHSRLRGDRTLARWLSESRASGRRLAERERAEAARTRELVARARRLNADIHAVERKLARARVTLRRTASRVARDGQCVVPGRGARPAAGARTGLPLPRTEAREPEGARQPGRSYRADPEQPDLGQSDPGRPDPGQSDPGWPGSGSSGSGSFVSRGPGLRPPLQDADPGAGSGSDPRSDAESSPRDWLLSGTGRGSGSGSGSRAWPLSRPGNGRGSGPRAWPLSGSGGGSASGPFAWPVAGSGNGPDARPRAWPLSGSGRITRPPYADRVDADGAAEPDDATRDGLLLPYAGSADSAGSANSSGSPESAAPVASAYEPDSSGSRTGAGGPSRAKRAGTRAAPRAAWTRPVAAYTLSAGFGRAGSRWAHRHTGQDFAVAVGTPVQAVGHGEVVSLGCGGPYGMSVLLRHAGGAYTQYAHLSAVFAAPGARVRAGQWIALSGDTGNSTGPHLHFEVRRGPKSRSAVDPVGWLRRRAVSLPARVDGKR